MKRLVRSLAWLAVLAVLAPALVGCQAQVRLTFHEDRTADLDAIVRDYASGPGEGCTGMVYQSMNGPSIMAAPVDPNDPTGRVI